MNALDQIFVDMGIHKNPRLLKEEYASRINVSRVDQNKLKQYQKLLFEISRAHTKLVKYNIYFDHFYPATDQIQKCEALEHHIHAYLQDLVILKNKITCFLGILKHDLMKVAANHKEVEEALTFLTKQVQNTFKEVSAYRNPHHHSGPRFVDSDLVDSQTAHTLLRKDHFLRDKFVPEFLEELRYQEVESFEKARKRWVGIAHKNNEQISGLVNEVFERTKDWLYQFLEMRPVKEIIAQNSN